MEVPNNVTSALKCKTLGAWNEVVDLNACTRITRDMINPRRMRERVTVVGLSVCLRSTVHKVGLNAILRPLDQNKLHVKDTYRVRFAKKALVRKIYKYLLTLTIHGKFCRRRLYQRVVLE